MYVYVQSEPGLFTVGHGEPNSSAKEGTWHPDSDWNSREEAAARCNYLNGGFPPERREALAAYAHDAWSGWMKYLFGKCEKGGGGHALIPPWAVERWMRQMDTAYKDLPEDEKESDRKEADRMLAIMAGARSQ